MAEKKKYNSILISGRKDETLTYSKYVKDEESGESVKESLDKKVNVTDELTTQQIKDGAITNEKIAADSVGNINLQDGSVSNEKLEDGSITNEKLAENSITKDKLKDNTIGVEKLDPELRQTINAATGLPENLVETIQNVDDTLKDHQRQIDDKQSQIDDKQQQITANDEDISLLQTRSTQMEETIKSIAATGGASQATAVTYNNEKSKLTAVNIQSAVDEVVDKTAIKDEEGTVVETPFRYIQNEEFIFAKVDAEDKLLFGFQWDGTPVFGKTSAVEDRLQSQVNLLADKITTILGDDDTTSAIDTLKELKEFFANIDNTQTLISILANLNSVSTKLGEDIKNLQDTKVDKEEGKSLIEDEVKECFRIIENEEFLKAIVDSDDKVLFGFYRATGKPYYPLNEMYHVIQNEEYFAAWLDANNKILFGIKTDGSTYIAKSEYINAVKEIQAKIESLSETFSHQDNPEFMAVTTDSEGKVLEATQSDGKKYFPKQALLDKYDDVEGRTEMTLDAEDRVLAYRDKEGIKHEEKLALHEVYDKDNNKINLATKEDVENVTVDPSDINIADLEGVSNHNTPNLLIASEMQKTFNDGTNSFTPPNEGYEMSNPIECQAGDWFTRTGTATGMVVVTDENDKNGTRLFNADGTTLGSTFQIPADMTWVKYIRMAAEVVGAEDGSVVICKGKEAFTGEDRGDYLTVTKLRIGKRNLSKDVMYVKSEDGTKFYELYVDSTGALKAREIDPDVIPESDYPTTWYPIQLTGSFNGYCDRIPMVTNRYLWIMKATGPTNIKTFKQQIVNTYNTFDHYYNNSGEERFVTIYGGESAATGVKNGATIYDKDLNIIEEGIHPDSYGYDPHDVAYINDDHLIFFSSPEETINVPGIGNASILGIKIEEVKKINGVWQNVGKFESKNYPQLYTDAYGNLSDNPISSHINTLTLDYDGNLIVNCRNWESWIKIKRVENGDGTVTIGSKTHDYNEAIIGRVGGRHNSAYIDSKRVLNDGFSFTNTPASLTEISDDDWEEWQWFHCHDVKYWGMKKIDGKQYPTYTLFDNNMWTGTSETGLYNATNKHNNITLNPNGDGSHYLEEYTSEDGYEEYQHSNVVQMSIDWENHLIKDYRVYVVPKLYTQQQGGATMFDEGIVGISYSSEGTFGIWDFTTEETNITSHTYRGAKEVFKGKYDTYRICYRINAYKIK